MKMRNIAAIALLVVMITTTIPIQQARADEVGISIQGPPAIGISKMVNFTVLVSGGPAAGAKNGTYSIKGWVLGEKVETAKPLASSPFVGNSTDGKFVVNVTAPDHTGKITLVVEATSRGENETQSQAKKELDIFVVNPITIDVKIINHGQTSAKNVTIFYYLDGDLIGNRTLPDLPAKNTTNISFEYAPPTLTPGRHVLRAVIDPRHALVEFDEGNNVLEREFFLYSPEPDTLPYWVILFIATAVGVVVVFWRASKKKEKLKEKE